MKFIKKLQNKTTIVTKEKKLKLNNKLRSNKNLHLNKINTNQIFKIFLKRLIKYNLNLKSYMLQKNKLNFLINIKKDNLYILNTNIYKFIIQTNNLISPFEDKHVILKNKKINKNYK